MKNRNEGPVSHIIETDEQRRIRGRFYTPQIFADFGLEMLDSALGEGWEDRYVVWDPCCGEKALTRSRKFRELYCGTIDEEELEHSSQYNPEATSYLFDFLNDPLENLPSGLLEAFEQDRPLVVIMNPPYGRAGKSDDGAGFMGIKKGSTMTMVNKRMKQDKVGLSSRNLYAQFIYRILLIKEKYNLSDINIGLFCKPGYLATPAYNGFRKRFLADFQYLGGILFNAGYFSGVSATWGIDFTVWTAGETVDKNNFPHMLVEVFDGTITPVGEKVIYNLDRETTASDWSKEPINGIETYDCPQMTSGLKIKQEGKTMSGRMADGALGSFYKNGNNTSKNSHGTALFTSGYSAINNFPVMTSNFERCTALFAARSLIQSNWINDEDGYMKPYDFDAEFDEFVADSVVYSLFDNNSQQTSLKNITYKGKQWDIPNQWFWLPKEMIAIK